MIRNLAGQDGSVERECEALLTIAADYEPATEMPFDLETRALSDAVSRRRIASNALRLAAIGGALTFGLFQLLAATMHRTSRPIDSGTKGQIAVIYNPIRPTPIPNAIQPHISSQGLQVVSGGRNLKSVGARRDDHVSRVAIAGLRQRIRRSHTKRRILVVHADHSPSIPASAGKGSIWRTEIVSTQTVGYLTPVWIAVTDNEHHSVLLSPALLGVPYQARQSLCSGDDMADEVHIQN